MSFVEVPSHWRCPNCRHVNLYYRNWQYLYSFNEILDEIEYSKETCKNCGKEYYVADTEPNSFCFPSMRKENASPCKNDYVKNLVLSTDLSITIKSTCVTS